MSNWCNWSSRPKRNTLLNGTVLTSAVNAGDNTVITAENKPYDGNTDATIATRTLTGVLVADVGKVSLTGGTAPLILPM